MATILSGAFIVLDPWLAGRPRRPDLVMRAICFSHAWDSIFLRARTGMSRELFGPRLCHIGVCRDDDGDEDRICFGSSRACQWCAQALPRETFWMPWAGKEAGAPWKPWQADRGPNNGISEGTHGWACLGKKSSYPRLECIACMRMGFGCHGGRPISPASMAPEQPPCPP